MQYLLETKKHIEQVQQCLKDICSKLQLRSYDHDMSRYRRPGSLKFREVYSELKETEGNDEIHLSILEKLRILREKYFKTCRYCPESHDNNVSEMNLVDLLELLSDWKADSSDLKKTIIENQKKYKYTDELMNVLLNTAKYLGWIDER